MALAKIALKGNTRHELRLLASGKSAIPDDISGQHLILGLFAKTDDDSRSTVSAVTVSQADRTVFLTQADLIAREYSRKSGAPGNYRLALNGPETGSRKELHAHIYICDLNPEQLAERGYEFLRAVSKEGFIVKKKEA